MMYVSQVFQTSVDKRPWKRCATHVHICHLIRLLQTEESEDSLLQPKQIKQDKDRKQEQFAQISLNGFRGVFSAAGIESGTKRRLDEVRSVTLLPKNHTQDRQVACPPSIFPKPEKLVSSSCLLSFTFSIFFLLSLCPYS